MIYIIGSGPVSYALIHSLRANGCLDKITVLTGAVSKASSDINWRKSISPKFLQKEVLKTIDRELLFNDDFIHISTLGVGGGVRFWGASIASFSKSDLEKSNLNYETYLKALDSVYCLLNSYNTAINPLSDYINDNLIKSFNDDQVFFKFKNVNLAVDGNKCIGCGQCISGCKHDAIWSPGAAMFNSLGVDLLDLYVDNISFDRGVVKKIITSGGGINVDRLDSVILATNPASAFKLLSPLSEIKKANFGSCPSFAFAIPKVCKSNKRKLFGMGEHTFECKLDNDTIFFGNLYDGSVLSRDPNQIFSTGNRLVNKIKKYAMRYFVLGAGFIDSSNVNIEISLSIENKINFKIISDVESKLVDKLKKNIFASSTLGLGCQFQRGVLGADLHYCDGVPLDVNIDGNTGVVDNCKNLKVVGSPNFKFLPSASPTLSFMANAYIIGSNHATAL